MSPSPISPDRIPVIVGVGEIVDRPKDIEQGLEPLALLEQALRRAEADASAHLLRDIRSLDVVNFLSWRIATLRGCSATGSVESFTALFRPNGEIEHGVVMLRTEADARTLARVPAQDGTTLAHLMNMERSPVGSIGEIIMAADGVPQWRVG